MTDQEIGGDPEWILDQRNEPAAYVRGSLPTVQVTFFVRGLPPALKLEVGALGDEGMLIAPTPLNILEGGSYITSPLTLQFSQRLPDRIGRHTVHLRWFVLWREKDGTPRQIFLTPTTHTVCTTWKPMVARKEERLGTSVYLPLVLWTCEWCAGADNEKSICDAIIRGLPRSGLRYGLPNWSVRQLLLAGGGLCGAFYQLFQQMAHCQGGFVEGRCLFLPIEHPMPISGSQQEFRSQLLIASLAGLGNVLPSPESSDYYQYNDCLTQFPPDLLANITDATEWRYGFWGPPYHFKNGHCFNFLQHEGKLYVYDASFQLGGIQVDMTLPISGSMLKPGPEQRSLFLQYLSIIFGVMGNLTVEGYHFETRYPKPSGVNVALSLLPPVILEWSE